jgi:hypothetical protein
MNERTVPKDLLRLRDALNVVLERSPLLELFLDLTVVNESNRRDHFRVKAKRTACHRTVAELALKSALRGSGVAVGAPRRLVVLFTRAYAGRGRRFDDDGAWSATKAIQDGVADALGVNDADARVVWIPTQQEKGTVAGVRVAIYEATR